MSMSIDRLTAELPLVAPLHTFSAADLQQAGGKGANLGELVRGGFRIPPGFVVTTAAYDHFVAHNGLREAIAQALQQEEGSGAVIRAAFQAGTIPPDVADEIRASYRRLGQGAIAARSSATAEDLPEAAFAGQQDTYLNVVGDDALLDAVRRCWASLWTDRAIAYRRRLDLDQQTVKIAVVVQRMVDAEFAGVMFTANPVSGARDEVVVDASPGLGEAIVSGQVTPDHFVLQRRGTGRVARLFARTALLAWQWRLVERQMGKREVIMRAREGGGIEHIAGEHAAERQVLSDRTLQQLARIGREIERHFGVPQDVEWAWARGELFILQARPITALPAPPPQLNRLQRHLASNFAEMIPIRPYPLDISTTLPAIGSAVEPLFVFMGLDWHFSRLFDAAGSVVIRFHPRLPRPTWRTLLAPIRLVTYSRRYDPRQWQEDPLLADVLAHTRELESRDLQALSWSELLTTLYEAMAIPAVAGQIRARYFAGAVFAMARLRLFLGLLGAADRLGVLLSGVPNKTLEANQALEDLARKVRSEPQLAHLFATREPDRLWPALEQLPAGRTFLEDLRAFLDDFGHRESAISTALAPSWKDAPEIVLGIVKSFAAYPPSLRGGKPAWQAAHDELLKRRLLRIPILRDAFLNALAAARVVLQIREDTHFYATLCLPTLRRVALEFGSRLVSAGLLDAQEDVFHLTLAELAPLGSHLPGRLPPALSADLCNLVAQRKKKRAQLQGTPLIDPRLFPQSKAADDALLRGTPGSPGVAEGPARIVRDATEFSKLRAGDVLVAPHTNPAWTPLFQRAVAVVVDSGSPVSHAAIVAREYGIPAVMATVTGTQTLQDGEPVRVDGGQGAVFRVMS